LKTELHVVEILLMIVLAFGLARLLGRAVELVGVPGVIGELMAGAILGPQLLGLVEPTVFFESLAELGVILLLFMAGLETHVQQLLAVRRSAVTVGVFGAVLPMAAGALAGWALGYSLPESLFVGVALMATSVGITIRVLFDLGVGQRKSTRIILAAAVLDDILGLLALVVVTALALGRTNYLELVLLSLQAVTYVVFVSVLGPWAVTRFSRALRRLPKNMLFELSVLLMLALSLLAEYIGLAAIIGAFLAGLVISDLKQHTELEHQFQPLSWFFVPFFFVLMGTYIDFAAFARPAVLIATVSFTVLAVLTKYFGALLGARHEGKRIAREVGVGMIPRGEVGIVVAGIALSTGAIADDVYTAVVGMVVLTTFLSPFLIKAVYKRGDRSAAADEARAQRAEGSGGPQAADEPAATDTAGAAGPAADTQMAAADDETPGERAPD
jgi:Kef-type K+ transport system membrane component KefB